MKYLISISKKSALQASNLYQQLRTMLLHFDAIGIECSMEERLIGDRYFYILAWHLRRKSEMELIRNELAKTISLYIFENQNSEIIQRIILKDHGLQLQGEVKEIEKYVYKRIQRTPKAHESSPCKQQRVNQLQKSLSSYLSDYQLLAIDGYCYFRMHGYRNVLSGLITEAIEEYLLDKEYQDFIQLLKYFVSIQPSKIAMVHIIHQGKGKIHLCDSNGLPLKCKDLDPSFSDTFSQEDLIVSTLLTMAPERVFLHTQSPQENVIRTVQQIFEGRIVLCQGCADCNLSIQP